LKTVSDDNLDPNCNFFLQGNIAVQATVDHLCIQTSKLNQPATKAAPGGLAFQQYEFPNFLPFFGQIRKYIPNNNAPSVISCYAVFSIHADTKILSTSLLVDYTYS
jgi:hypothetical protein